MSRPYGYGCATCRINRRGLTVGMIPAEFDFRMHAPDDPLVRAVGHVWHARGQSPHGRERILPSASPVLLVILGPPLRMSAPGAENETEELAGAWITGPHDRPIINEPTGETHVLGATFTPGGLAPFLTTSIAELFNRIVRLEDLETCFDAVNSLMDRVSNMEDPTAPMLELVQWFERSRGARTLDDRWHDVIRRLAMYESASVAAIQESIGVSRRHFTAEVRRRTGLAPKALQRIVRMRRLLNEIDARKPIKWSREAMGAGYFDQAHAIRDFKTFTGLTPTEYVERRRYAWGTAVEPGEATNFVPEIIR